MKKDIKKIIELPESVSVEYKNNELVLKKEGKELKKKFKLNPKIKLEIENKKIILFSKSGSRREAKVIGTLNGHILNLIKGLSEGFEYKLEVCNIHFPMNVKQEGDLVVIKSFLGAKSPRVARILPDVKIEIKGNFITVKSDYIEKAGQTAANIEKATRIIGKDKRIFQDGIFIIEKNRRKI